MVEISLHPSKIVVENNEFIHRDDGGLMKKWNMRLYVCEKCNGGVEFFMLWKAFANQIGKTYYIKLERYFREMENIGEQDKFIFKICRFITDELPMMVSGQDEKGIVRYFNHRGVAIYHQGGGVYETYQVNEDKENIDIVKIDEREVNTKEEGSYHTYFMQIGM